MTEDLTRLTVVVTRPGKPGLQLCKEIEALHGQAFHFPTIAFVANENPNPLNLIHSIARYDLLIFISPQSVRFFFALLEKSGLSLPISIKTAAVGKATAAALIENGMTNVFYPKKDWTSEGLLRELKDQPIFGKKVGLVCGEGGRETLQQELTAKGAQVTRIEVYRRMLPIIKTDFAWLSSQNAPIYVCASYTGVVHLQTLIGPKMGSVLLSAPLVVVSERIKLLAQELGFQRIWVAKDASHASIIEVLQEVKGTI